MQKVTADPSYIHPILFHWTYILMDEHHSHLSFRTPSVYHKSGPENIVPVNIPTAKTTLS